MGVRSVLAAALLLIASAVLAAEPQVQRDVAYAGTKNERQTLDIYAPAAGQDHPVMFWIHGGGWQHGDKTEVGKKPPAFVGKGFVFVSTNYRFVPDASIKELAGDVAKAIRWTHDHAKQFGGDPDTIFVMGHSAGAQLAALVSTDDRYLKAEGLTLATIKGCVPVDGDTYDLPMQIASVEERRSDFFKRHFGDEQSQEELSSVAHAGPGKHIPPFLILHVADHPETKAQSQRLARALKAAGVPVTVYPAEGRTHVSLDAELGPPDDRPTQAVWEFVDGVLKK